MTSLQHQLKKLKKAPAQALAVERDHSSLIFNQNEAASYDREDFYKIGLGGLHGMKNLDENFDEYGPELFEKQRLNVNRAMFSKYEEDEFNQRIEAMILRLSPYLHHHCCRQVLEWLIHQYQVHIFNAETLFLAFLPYHSLNTFGRLLHILKFNSPDFNWLEDYQKDASTIPINILCRACQSGRSYWLISALATFVQRAIEILDADYVNTKMQHYITFLVTLIGTLIENNSEELDNQFASRLMPLLGNALRSKMESFKCAGIMILSVLVMNTTLDEDLESSVLKLLLHKVDANLCELVLQTTNVICERSATAKLPRRSILRLVQKSGEIKLGNLLSMLMLKYDMTAFLVLFWQILMEELKTNETPEWRGNYTNLLITLLDMEHINEHQAQKIFALLLDWVESVVSEEADEKQHGREGGQKIRIFPKALRKHVRAMVLHFSTTFDSVRSERAAESTQRLMEECHISSHEVGKLETMPKEMEEAKQTQNKRKRKGKKRKLELGSDEDQEGAGWPRTDEN